MIRVHESEDFAAMRQRAIDAECELAALSEELAEFTADLIEVERERDALAIAMVGFLDGMNALSMPLPETLAVVRELALRIAKPLVANAAAKVAS